MRAGGELCSCGKTEAKIIAGVFDDVKLVSMLEKIYDVNSAGQLNINLAAQRGVPYVGTFIKDRRTMDNNYFTEKIAPKNKPVQENTETKPQQTVRQI